MTAAILEIELEDCIVDVAADAQHQPAYLALNPNGLFPTLVDGNFILWETMAIMNYLASQRPESQIFPALDSRSQADILRWQSWNLEHWSPALRVFVFQNIFKKWKGLGEPDVEEIRRGESAYHRLAAILDQHLEGRSWLVGNGLTLADISVSSYLMYSEQARIPLDPYQHLRRWFGQIQSEPAWLATRPSTH